MMKTENIAIIISIFALIFMITSWYIDYDLQRQGAQKEEAKENKPPTVSLTQDYTGVDYGRLEIRPTLYFRKNSKGEGHFTILKYQANFTLNGKDVGNKPVGGYPTKYSTEQLPYEENIISQVYPSINYSEFSHNDSLVIDYVLEIKDMDSQIVYRGNVTTEINGSGYPYYFPSGNRPLIFEFSPLEKKK